MKKNFLIVVIILCIINVTAFFVFRKKEDGNINSTVIIEPSWDGATLIGHGMFGIDDNIRTNSKEAFKLGYKKGIRDFEIDMLLTSDDKLVLLHSWNEFYNNKKYNGNGATLKEFLSKKVLNKYSPMTYKDVVSLLKEYNDIWIVTDTKYYENKDKEKIITEFNTIVNEANSDEEILNRLIIQIYNEEMLTTIRDIYPFKNVILTLYNIWDGKIDNFEHYVQFVKNNHLAGLTIPENYFNEEIMTIAKNYDINLYLHTIDDLTNAKKYLDMGVRGLYTDTIIPNDLQ